MISVLSAIHGRSAWWVETRCTLQLVMVGGANIQRVALIFARSIVLSADSRRGTSRNALVSRRLSQHWTCVPSVRSMQQCLLRRFNNNDRVYFFSNLLPSDFSKDLKYLPILMVCIQSLSIGRVLYCQIAAAPTGIDVSEIGSRSLTITQATEYSTGEGQGPKPHRERESIDRDEMMPYMQDT